MVEKKSQVPPTSTDNAAARFVAWAEGSFEEKGEGGFLSIVEIGIWNCQLEGPIQKSVGGSYSIYIMYIHIYIYT